MDAQLGAASGVVYVVKGFYEPTVKSSAGKNPGKWLPLPLQHVCAEEALQKANIKMLLVSIASGGLRVAVSTKWKEDAMVLCKNLKAFDALSLPLQVIAAAALVGLESTWEKAASQHRHCLQVHHMGALQISSIGDLQLSGLGKILGEMANADGEPPPDLKHVCSAQREFLKKTFLPVVEPLATS